MNFEENSVSVNQSTPMLTFKPWYEHSKDFLFAEWKYFIVFLVALFGIFWGIIEALSFYIPNLPLNNQKVLYGLLTICIISVLIKCIQNYNSTIIKGLEEENSAVQKIAFLQKPFWEFALTHELLISRIKNIDQKLDDVLNNRVHIPVNKSMDEHQYLEWMHSRPENLRRLVSVCKQILIFDLIKAMHADKSNEVYFQSLVRVANLVEDVYQKTYEYEIQGLEIAVPNTFELVHKIQSGWASVIRDGIIQMLDILHAVSKRNKDDFSPINQIITFCEPPLIKEFLDEVDRIQEQFDN